jgi:succinate dehydrogenase / fumarate reductase, flavoprotein subunit
MQGLADGYFVLPYTVSNYLADEIRTGKISTDSPEFAQAENNVKETIEKFINNNGTKSVDHFHKRLGHVMWNKVGMARNEKGLKEAIEEIGQIRDEFYKDVYVPGSADELNPELEKALRVSDLLELGQLMAMDALQRNESCGGHFREEYQDAEGETLRDDENFSFVSAWEYKGQDTTQAVLHKEELKYEFIKIAARNYK